jgi:transposase
MRGELLETDAMFSYVSPSQRVPRDHPLRAIREVTDAALRRLWPEFQKLYSTTGRPSVPPERLLRALLLQYFYGIRSERLLIEQLEYNLLFRWFVGLGMDDPIWDSTTFTKNRSRLLSGDVARRFFEEIVAEATSRGLTSDEHFSVDGTLLQAWASHKSFKPKDDSHEPPDAGSMGPRERNFKGEKRRNDTHQSSTDPQAKLYRKAHCAESRLSYMGHVVVENRHGLVVRCEATQADGYAERDTAVKLLSETSRSKRATTGADKGYDTAACVTALRDLGITPHVAQNCSNRRSAIDGRTTRHPGYSVSQRLRKAVEHPFGWMKSAACIRQVKHRGVRLVNWTFTMTMAAFNLIRMRSLVARPA